MIVAKATELLQTKEEAPTAVNVEDPPAQIAVGEAAAVTTGKG
jgi:hypothetical protein